MSQAEQPFHGDRPIEVPSEDRLGFEPAAKHVADAIHGMASPDGFVVGIEGEWGSGKSSFINLVSSALQKRERAPEIIRFLPWLISSREGLLRELFTEITKAALRIDSVDAPPKGWKKLCGHIWPDRYAAQAIRKRKLKGLFSQFSSRLVQAGKVAELLGLTGAGMATEAGKRAIEEWLGSASLEKEKSRIQDELRKLERKIVVFIDDLDRLEPHEVAEVLRLVRAVVDFPNVVYVLCYSREIVASILATALHIDKGDEFLEKIVQVSFSVPRPEAFDLRRMFRRELQLLYPDLLGSDTAQSHAVVDKLAQIIDDEGGRALLTPRHVVRAINALRFHATPVLDSIDIPDMVWLQLVRIQSTKLYEWIEGYLIGFAAKHAGAMIGGEGKKAELEQLDSLFVGLPDNGVARNARCLALVGVLPGVDFDFEGEGDQQKMLLSLYGDDDASSYIQGRRLGSPQHFRYYFALTMPQGAVHDREYALFLGNAKDHPDAAAAQFAQLATTTTAEDRVAAQALLDRLKGNGMLDVPESAIPGIMRALSDSMDIAALKTGKGDWGQYWVWRDADAVLRSAWPKLTGRSSENSKNDIIRSVFGDGKAIGWLTDIFRREIFAHGIYGNNAKSEDERLLSREELGIAAHELLQRYRSLLPESLPNLLNITDMFYAWKQYAPEDSDEIREKVEELTRGDEGFLDLLQGMRGWQASNGAVLHPLIASSLSLFMDVEQTTARLQSLAGSHVSSIAVRARDLLEALRTGTSE